MSSSGIKYLTEDMIYEVLLRLPVKSLLRFKAVSKPWCSLISGPSFISSHHILALTMPGADQTLIVQNYDNKASFSLLDLGHDRLVFDDLGSPFPVDAVSPPFLKYLRDDFFPLAENNFMLIGSARGIVCVSVSKDLIYYERFAHIYLWNPATKRSKLIAPQQINYSRKPEALGFGFEPIDDDFKVVWVFSHEYEVEVYSSNMNAWRKIGPKPVDDSMSKCGICVKGFLCWTGRHRIVAFDLNTEVFNCGTMFPHVLSKEIFYEYCVIDFNNSIAVIEDTGWNGKIMLWTLDNVECLRGDGGVVASWTLLLSTDKNLPLLHVHSYFNNGDFLLRSIDHNHVCGAVES